MINIKGQDYKKSKFNILVPYDNDEVIIYNPLSGAIGLLDQETLHRYEAETLLPTEIETLIQKRIIVPIQLNENEKVNKDRIDGIENDHKKFYRIWTTSGCNACCFYCFERGIKPTNMSVEVAEKVASFISANVNIDDSVQIEWFGGEPLINMTAIDVITTKLSSELAEKGIVPTYDIITNGSLINEEIAAKMKEKWHIRKAQITLDGFEREYDKVKAYKDNSTFNKVIANIHSLLNHGIRVSIRINYSKPYYVTIKQLIIFLSEEFKDERMLSAYVYPLWSALNPDKKEDGFLTEGNADYGFIDICDLLYRKNLNDIRNITRLRYKKHQCMACNKSSLTIFPDGTFGKCGEVYTQKIGDVEEGIVNTALFDYWTDTSLDEECQDCIYLPLCQGGDRSAKYSNMPKCFVTKDIMPDLLKWYIGCLVEKNEK